MSKAFTGAGLFLKRGQICGLQGGICSRGHSLWVKPRQAHVTTSLLGCHLPVLLHSLLYRILLISIVCTHIRVSGSVSKDSILKTSSGPSYTSFMLNSPYSCGLLNNPPSPSTHTIRPHSNSWKLQMSACMANGTLQV